jgi:hypothetical protein
MWLHTYDVCVCVCVCDAFYCTTWKDECMWDNLIYLKFGINIIVKWFHSANLIFSHN